MYSLDWKHKAQKQLSKIGDRTIREEIYEAAQALCNFPNISQVKKLTDHKYPYRLRIGRYRLFFEVAESVRIIMIEEVKKRDDRTY
jgi:mRNA-degrading endonuclease RelE of RelBE toxin-antitoxin system